LHFYVFIKTLPSKRTTVLINGLFKIPNSTNPICVVLIVVVLVAIVEVLFPSVVVIVLGRTPIVGTSKTANRKNKGVHINTRLLIFIVELFKANYLVSSNSHFNCFCKQSLYRF